MIRSKSCACLFVIIASFSLDTGTGQGRPAGTPVFGTVRDLAGAPVAGAAVHAVRLVTPGLTSFLAGTVGVGVTLSDTTTTDRHGKFVLRVRSAARFGIVATKGRTRSETIAPASPAATYELRLHPIRKLRGRLVHVRAGRELPPGIRTIRSVGPVRSGVGTRPWPHRYLAMLDTQQTDAHGSFEVDVLAGTRCSVESVPDGASTVVEVPKLGQPAEPIVVRRPVRRVLCKVTGSDTKKPIAGAMIHAMGEAAAATVEGHAEIDVPGAYNSVIDAPGYRPYYVPSDRKGRIDVELAKGPVAKMRFVDAKGLPCSNLELCVSRIAHGPGGSGPLTVRMKADAAGRFSIARCERHGAVVWAKLRDRFVRICDIKSGNAPLDLGDLSTKTFDIRGHIQDVDGVPAAHLPVFAGPVETAFGSRWPLAQEPAAFTDHAGRFVIAALPQRRYQVASRSKRSFATFAPIVTPGRSKPFTLELKRAPILAGQVVDGDGKPLSGVRVSAAPRGNVDPRISQYGLWTTYGRTDARGRFSLPAVAAGVVHRLHAAQWIENLSSDPVDATPPATDLQIEVRKN